MALGQRTFLQLVNRVLARLGKVQTTATLSGVAADSWAGLARDAVNQAQQELYLLHDWSTLYASGTFTTSNRTYDLSTSFSTWGREIDLVDTTNDYVLTPVDLRTIDEIDHDLDDAGAPRRYSINYPNLLFDRTPSSVAFRIRYLKRPTDLSANADVTILPEYCDTAIFLHAVWDLLTTREDDAKMGEAVGMRYKAAVGQAIAQDTRRMDRVRRLRPVYDHRFLGRAPAAFPPSYGADRY